MSRVTHALLVVACAGTSVGGGACATTGRDHGMTSAESLPNGGVETASWAPLPTCGEQPALPSDYQPLPLDRSCVFRIESTTPWPAVVLSSAEELDAALGCPADAERPAIDFSMKQVVVAIAAGEDPQPYVTFLAQGAVVTAVHQRGTYCPGGMAREFRHVPVAVVVPRQPSLRAARRVQRATARLQRPTAPVSASVATSRATGSVPIASTRDAATTRPVG